MAQITLNLKSNSESFTTNDSDILYVSNLYDSAGVVDGATLTVIDTASAVTTTIDVEETITDIKLLTTALVQINTTQNESPLICISRIKDIFTYGSYANIRYDDNGNVFAVIKTTMTTAQILSTINTEVNEPLIYEALLTQVGTSAPTATVLKNTLGTVSFARSSAGQYTVTATGLLTLNKTDISFNNVLNGATTVYANIAVDDATLTLNGFEILTIGDSATQVDEILLHTRIGIKVYP